VIDASEAEVVAILPPIGRIGECAVLLHVRGLFAVTLVVTGSDLIQLGSGVSAPKAVLPICDGAIYSLTAQADKEWRLAPLGSKDSDFKTLKGRIAGELLVEDGSSAPPITLTNEAEDDWLYED
jgi:hypothetical protein